MKNNASEATTLHQRLILSVIILMTTSSVSMALDDVATKSPNVEGHWEGVLHLASQPVRLVLHLQPSGDGEWSASIDSPDQGGFRIPASKIIVHDDEVMGEWYDLQAKLEVRRSLDGKALLGTWIQGIDFDVMLYQVENNRPQEPFPPYPYSEVEVVVPNVEAALNLAGTLTIPKGDGPFPAIILITGSGPQNRDQEILGHKSFKVIADYLTRRGIVVLRCDDRGFGNSTGTFANATLFDFVSDAEASLKFLRTRPEVATNCIGLLGHSEGGTVASIAAAQASDVAFLILLAAPSLNGEQTLLVQSKAMLESQGISSQLIEMNEDVQRGIFRIAMEETNFETAIPKFVSLRDEIEKKHKETLEQSFENDGLIVWRSNFMVDAQRSITPWFKTFLSTEPKQWLRELVAPTLVLVGELDTQVVPSEHLPVIEESLKSAGNVQFEIRVLPKQNHQFQTCMSGSPAEYDDIYETISPLTLDAIGQWLSKLFQTHCGSLVDQS